MRAPCASVPGALLTSVATTSASVVGIEVPQSLLQLYALTLALHLQIVVNTCVTRARVPVEVEDVVTA